MEYILTIFLTFVLVYTILKFTTRQRLKYFDDITYSQSSIHSRLKYLVPEYTIKKNKIVSQADKHINKNMIKMIVVDNKAYWTIENIFYVADVQDGDILPDTVQQIDTSEMSQDELDKMLKILDNLNSGGI